MKNSSQRVYDLEERTAKFGEGIISLCKQIKQTNVTNPLLSQLLRSGTSVGANYCEANNASSKKDFRNKIFICKKEIQETKYWLRMIVMEDSVNQDTIRTLWKEAQELTFIFQKIINSLSKDSDKEK